LAEQTESRATGRGGERKIGKRGPCIRVGVALKSGGLIRLSCYKDSGDTIFKIREFGEKKQTTETSEIKKNLGSRGGLG